MCFFWKTFIKDFERSPLDTKFVREFKFADDKSLKCILHHISDAFCQSRRKWTGSGEHDMSNYLIYHSCREILEDLDNSILHLLHDVMSGSESQCFFFSGGVFFRRSATILAGETPDKFDLARLLCDRAFHCSFNRKQQAVEDGRDA